MANTGNRRRYARGRFQKNVMSYEEGSAARRLDIEPEPQKPVLSKTARKNRVKSMNMGKGYIVFLSLVCALATGSCVHFLRLTAQVTEQRNMVAEREFKLSELKADNDAYYSEVMSKVDMKEIRDRAINEMNMQYATEEQIKYYTPGANSYVRQYQDVPEK